MSIPGRILKKIIDALISAFPTREKLLIMLRLELDIVEYYVPSASDYEDVVYNLVNKLDNQGRIMELLEGAYEHNQGNFYLQVLKQDIIPLIRLYQILNNFEKYLIDDIRKAYNQCCYDNLYTNDKIQFPETLQKILVNLVDMPRCNASHSPTELFIVYLLVNIDNFLPPKELDDLIKLGPGEFGDLEVPSLVKINERYYLMFSVLHTSHSIARNQRLQAQPVTGIHYMVADNALGKFRFSTDKFLIGEPTDPTGLLYCGKVVECRDGTFWFLASRLTDANGDFVGELIDPIALSTDCDGNLILL